MTLIDIFHFLFTVLTNSNQKKKKNQLTWKWRCGSVDALQKLVIWSSDEMRGCWIVADSDGLAWLRKMLVNSSWSNIGKWLMRADRERQCALVPTSEWSRCAVVVRYRRWKRWRDPHLFFRNCARSRIWWRWRR